jgi:hypothetical protein
MFHLQRTLTLGLGLTATIALLYACSAGEETKPVAAATPVYPADGTIEYGSAQADDLTQPASPFRSQITFASGAISFSFDGSPTTLAAQYNDDFRPADSNHFVHMFEFAIAPPSGFGVTLGAAWSNLATTPAMLRLQKQDGLAASLVPVVQYKPTTIVPLKDGVTAVYLEAIFSQVPMADGFDNGAIAVAPMEVGRALAVVTKSGRWYLANMDLYGSHGVVAAMPDAIAMPASAVAVPELAALRASEATYRGICMGAPPRAYELTSATLSEARAAVPAFAPESCAALTQ